MSNRWDERHRAASAGPGEPEPVLIRYASKIKPGTALDPGSGPGRNAIWLASGGWLVTAVDYSSVALEQLRARAGNFVETIQADLEREEYLIAPDSFDLICDCCFLHRPLFPAIRAGLREGGLFVGVFPLAGINPLFLIHPGELSAHFEGWQILHNVEDSFRAEFVARKPSVTARA